jgi:hypothetical protein
MISKPCGVFSKLGDKIGIIKASLLFWKIIRSDTEMLGWLIEIS